MSNDSNPYGGAGGGYATTVQFGKRPASEPQAAAANGPAGGPATEIIKDTTTAGFAGDVIRESRQQPVLVDFWAPWCGPCKQLTPALEKAVRAAGGKVKLVKMNIDEHPSIAGQLGIQSIPAVIAFKNGQPVDGFMGAIPESQIRDFLEKVIGKGAGAELADALAAATEALAAGDRQTAADIYSAVLEQTPDSAEAAAGLADLLFESGDAETARGVLGRVPADKQDSPAVAAVRAKIEAGGRCSSAWQSGRIRGPARQGSERSRGAVRPCGDPECARQTCRGGGQFAGHLQGRPHLARGRRAAAIAAVLRRMGCDRRSHVGQPPQAVVAAVLVTPGPGSPCLPCGRDSPLHIDYDVLWFWIRR